MNPNAVFGAALASPDLLKHFKHFLYFRTLLSIPCVEETLIIRKCQHEPRILSLPFNRCCPAIKTPALCCPKKKLKFVPVF